MTYSPRFRLTARVIGYLGKIEVAKETVDRTALSPLLERSFRTQAETKSVHYSTKIEGNRLTLAQTQELLKGKPVLARDVDKREAMNYYDCLEWIHSISSSKKPLSETHVRHMHALIQKGIVKGKLRGYYREAQNAIFDAKTGKAVYYPPETKDVTPLMADLLRWLNSDHDAHPLVLAGVAHYQLVTIHPFMDGNGRVARSLATLLLARARYDLKRFYSLEEYYADDLQGYYDVLHRCQGMHYYDQTNPDISDWLDYFIHAAAVVFEQAKETVLEAASKRNASAPIDVALLQSIGPREKKLMAFLRKHLQVRARDVVSLYGIRERSARDLIKKWIIAGLLLKRGTGNRDAHYVLADRYRSLL